ncbi:MAG: UPF0149 family protein [Betaproteobacteria bacterium]
MARLSETDLDRLEAYLDAPERTSTAMPLDMAQGLLAAVASAPSPVPQSRWLAEVLGADPAFASPAEESEITALLTRFAEDIARQLNEGEGFDFILYGEDDDLAPWAQGYLEGVELADPRWDEVADEEDLDNILFPFLALTGDAKEMALEAGEDWMSEEEEARMLADIRENFASHLFDVRQYFFEKGAPQTFRRDAPKVGRNDPCPCGSGKKYKNCHGAEG